MNYLKSNHLNRGIATVITIVLALVILPSAEAQGRMHFKQLKEQILSDTKSDLSSQWVEEVFSSPGLEFEIKGITSYFQHRESTLNYGQFISQKSIDNARKYMQEHKDVLERAESRFGVDKEVITAIMLVETRLGTYTGYQSVTNILATMAALSDQEVRDAFWNEIPSERRITREQYEKKADAKSSWAYRELIALLKYANSENIDPLSLKGSYAGALGIPQFMPSNILILAEDGNKDGRIDLFDHEDAIFSIASYLRHHGWRAGISQEKAQKVILHYNRSSYYSNTVMEITDRLKG